MKKFADILIDVFIALIFIICCTIAFYGLPDVDLYKSETECITDTIYKN